MAFIINGVHTPGRPYMPIFLTRLVLPIGYRVSTPRLVSWFTGRGEGGPSTRGKEQKVREYSWGHNVTIHTPGWRTVHQNGTLFGECLFSCFCVFLHVRYAFLLLSTNLQVLYQPSGSACSTGTDNVVTRAYLVYCHAPLSVVEVVVPDGLRSSRSIGVEVSTFHRALMTLQPYHSDTTGPARMTINGDNDGTVSIVGDSLFFELVLYDLDMERVNIPPIREKFQATIAHPARFVASMCAHARVFAGGGCRILVTPAAVQFITTTRGEVWGGTKWKRADPVSESTADEGGHECTVAQFGPVLSFFRKIPSPLVRSITVGVDPHETFARFRVWIGAKDGSAVEVGLIMAIQPPQKVAQ